MVTFQSNNNSAYKAADPHFKELYIDSTSYGTSSASAHLTEAWEALNRYVPFSFGSYGLLGNSPEADPLEQLVSHRSEVLKSQVECLTHQLYERGKIHEANLDRIDYDVVKIDSELLQVESLLRWNRIDPPQALAKKEQTLEKELLGLEKERRDEYTGFWKDRVLLRKELTEAMGGLAMARARGNALQEVSRDGI